MLAMCCSSTVLPASVEEIEEAGSKDKEAGVFADSTSTAVASEAKGGTDSVETMGGTDSIGTVGSTATSEGVASTETKPERSPYCKMGCGKPVQPGKTRRGNPFDTCCRSCAVNPGLGLHDSTCGGKKPTKPIRPACPKGSRCRNRAKEHLQEQAHPLDADYAECCTKSRVEPEPLSLKVIFDWTDADGSGKLSKEELQPMIEIISKNCGEYLPPITEETWKHLDEDGNGQVNFNEFATFFGPRLGLPLGMDRLLRRSSTTMKTREFHPCSVFGCPCEAYEVPPKKSAIKAFLPQSEKCNLCKHKKELHQTVERTGDIEYPEYWTNKAGSDFSSQTKMHEKAVMEMQALADQTYRNAWTRDRTRHNPMNPKVPKGFKIVNVFRNENSENWKEYYCRRIDVQVRMEEEKEYPGYEPVAIFDQVKTTKAWREIAGEKGDRLLPGINEWYLLHGTNPKSAKAICENDFKVGRAGENTGTLYGKGLYFAESFTKADEYSKPDAHGLHALLLCRVIGGRVRYTDSLTPDAEDLVYSCIEGKYDSVCGDREKARGTYREFVIFDSEDVYPEYIIEYTRIYG